MTGHSYFPASARRFAIRLTVKTNNPEVQSSERTKKSTEAKKHPRVRCTRLPFHGRVQSAPAVSRPDTEFTEQYVESGIRLRVS